MATEETSTLEGDCLTSATETHQAEKGASNSSSKNSDSRDGKKRDGQQHHRRKPSKKKRKWKPYNKMTWEEKKAVEEKEKVRAVRLRVEMMDRGRPVAPYNTTQFIMAEHDPYQEDAVLESVTNPEKEIDGLDQKSTNDAVKKIADSPCNMDDFIEAEYSDSPHMAPEFISQDFSEAYERVQEESLSTMSRNDLVKEHLSLERTLSYLQDKLAEEKNINNSYSLRVQNIEEELESLRNDNRRLVHENMCLRYGEDAAEQIEQNESGIFQASDYEYEAPSSHAEDGRFPETDPVDLPLSDEEELEDYDKNCEQCRKERQASLEEMVTSTTSLTVDSLEASRSLQSEERCYEADDALSEEPESRNDESRRKRRHVRDRGSMQHRRETTETNSSYEEELEVREKRLSKPKCTDQTKKNKKTSDEGLADDDESDSHTVTVKSVQQEIAMIGNQDEIIAVKSSSHTLIPAQIASSLKNTPKENSQNPFTRDLKPCDSQQDNSMPFHRITTDSMDVESITWDDKEASTASMHSVTSEDNEEKL